MRGSAVTRHRTKAERVREILLAAASEIDATGYARLTMDAIAARTSLSKAGVYCFFANKREVALALFRDIYEQYVGFDVDEALAWDLPMVPTLFRLLFERHDSEEHERSQRVWLQLLPETLHDEEFAAAKRSMSARYQQDYEALVRRLIDRDGTEVGTEFPARLDAAVLLGTCLMEGMTIEGVGGMARSRFAAPLRHFIEVMLSDVFHTQTD